MNKENNFAYIDANNLHKGIKNNNWDLDYYRFRIWLKEKYGVSKAYLFIGLLPSKKDLYTFLQEAGFILIYKEVVFDRNGKPKGNCDADLVLKSITDYYERGEEFNNSIIVSSDGDYACLIKFLKEKNKFKALLSPNIRKRCSFLLRKLNIPIVYLNTQKNILENKRRNPR
jgi:hypothetical protein